MCDHTAWGARVAREVNSPRVKLLYDIYHMQIMEEDLIATICENIDVLGHFHTGGVPGRHEIDGTQRFIIRADGSTGRSQLSRLHRARIRSEKRSSGFIAAGRGHL